MITNIKMVKNDEKMRKKENRKFIGFMLTEKVTTYLDLYCIAHDETKSDVLRHDIAEEWYRRQLEKNITVEVLKLKIIENTQKQWESKKNTLPNRFKSDICKKGFEGFKHDKYAELIGRVPKEILEDILSQLTLSH